MSGCVPLSSVDLRRFPAFSVAIVERIGMAKTLIVRLLAVCLTSTWARWAILGLATTANKRCGDGRNRMMPSDHWRSSLRNRSLRSNDTSKNNWKRNSADGLWR